MLDISFHSVALGKHQPFKVFLPETTDMLDGSDVKPLKTLMVLHGLSSDHTMFSRFTNLEMYANQHNLAVIMPDADHSFYLNMKYGHSYLDHIKEVWEYAHSILPLSKKREDNYITGNSMGGFGAFYVALQYPERFSKVAPMSGALGADDRLLDLEWYDFDVRALIGDSQTISGTPLDSSKIISDALEKHGAKNLPEIFVLCGTEDSLIEANKAFVQSLEEKGLDPISKFSTGEHNWSYWDSAVRDVVDWIFDGETIDTSKQIINWVG